jgi:hypothetical protein
MGKRGRAAGVSNAMVRAARAAWQERDDDAAALAQRVYVAADEGARSGEAGAIHPLLWAPVVVGAEMAAQVVVKANRLDPASTDEVAAYLTAGWLASVQLFDFQHFEVWRRATADDAGEQ